MPPDDNLVSYASDDKVFHALGTWGEEGCWDVLVIACRWCSHRFGAELGRRNQTTRHVVFPCPTCFPVSPEDRARIIALRESGTDPIEAAP